MRQPVPLAQQENQDPRLRSAQRNGTCARSTLFNGVFGPNDQWRDNRHYLLAHQRATWISSTKSERDQFLLTVWHKHNENTLEAYLREGFPIELCKLFAREYNVDKYAERQWEFAYYNTLCVIDDTTLKGDQNFVPHNPDHLGITWHFGRPPQEIYTTAKKLLLTCDSIDPSHFHTGYRQKEYFYSGKKIGA